MTRRVKDALQELDVMGGWRALIVLPPEAADADALIEALPWVENGTPRPGSLARLFKFKNGLALVTGGVLTDQEGAHLFDIHEQLKGVATRIFVVPPASAPQPFIEKMYLTGTAPSLPASENMPNSLGWSVLAILCLAVWMCWIVSDVMGPSPARVERAPLLQLVAQSSLLWIALVCGVMSWRRKRQLRGILEDPVRTTVIQWTPTLPPFPVRR